MGRDVGFEGSGMCMRVGWVLMRVGWDGALSKVLYLRDNYIIYNNQKNRKIVSKHQTKLTLDIETLCDV